MGRPKKNYRTTTIRIPIGIKDDVEELKLGYELLMYQSNEEGKIKTIHPMPKFKIICTNEICEGECIECKFMKKVSNTPHKMP